MELKTIFKKKVCTKNCSKTYISKKLYFEIKKLKEDLENTYYKKYGKKRCMPMQTASDLLADKIRYIRYKNKNG